jgi:uroporphyrinogen-III decarboxylase
MMLDLGEPVGALYHASDLTQYPLWSLTHTDIVRQLLDRRMEHKRIVYRWCLERDLADVYFLVGSELASPPMVSRETFRTWVLPYARELIEMIHGYGKKVIQHYHGQIGQIIADFPEMCPDGLHTIEAPPVGNCTLTQAYEATGDSITLIGNIQYDCFRSYTENQMREAVKGVLDECRGRRLILSPSAGPYEQEPSPQVFRNYHAFMEAGWEYGRVQ